MHASFFPALSVAVAFTHIARRLNRVFLEIVFLSYSFLNIILHKLITYAHRKLSFTRTLIRSPSFFLFSKRAQQKLEPTSNVSRNLDFLPYNRVKCVCVSVEASLSCSLINSYDHHLLKIGSLSLPLYSPPYTFLVIN